MIFFLTTLINIRKIEEVQILVLVPIHFQYVCFKWPNSFSMVSNSDNRVKAWYVYSIRFCILNNNLASIKWKLAIDFHLIFLLLFPIDCLTFKGFQSFFSKISLHKILKVKSFHVFFYMLLFKSFLLSFVFPEFVLILHWTKKMFFFSLVIMFLKWICWWQKMSYIIILNRRNDFFYLNLLYHSL